MDQQNERSVVDVPDQQTNTSESDLIVLDSVVGDMSDNLEAEPSELVTVVEEDELQDSIVTHDSEKSIITSDQIETCTSNLNDVEIKSSDTANNIDTVKSEEENTGANHESVNKEVSSENRETMVPTSTTVGLDANHSANDMYTGISDDDDMDQYCKGSAEEPDEMYVGISDDDDMEKYCNDTPEKPVTENTKVDAPHTSLTELYTGISDDEEDINMICQNDEKSKLDTEKRDENKPLKDMYTGISDDEDEMDNICQEGNMKVDVSPNTDVLNDDCTMKVQDDVNNIQNTEEKVKVDSPAVQDSSSSDFVNSNTKKAEDIPSAMTSTEMYCHISDGEEDFEEILDVTSKKNSNDTSVSEDGVLFSKVEETDVEAIESTHKETTTDSAQDDANISVTVCSKEVTLIEGDGHNVSEKPDLHSPKDDVNKSVNSVGSPTNKDAPSDKADTEIPTEKSATFGENAEAGSSGNHDSNSKLSTNLDSRQSSKHSSRHDSSHPIQNELQYCSRSSEKMCRLIGEMLDVCSDHKLKLNQQVADMIQLMPAHIQRKYFLHKKIVVAQTSDTDKEKAAVDTKPTSTVKNIIGKEGSIDAVNIDTTVCSSEAGVSTSSNQDISLDKKMKNSADDDSDSVSDETKKTSINDNQMTAAADDQTVDGLCSKDDAVTKENNENLSPANSGDVKLLADDQENVTNTSDEQIIEPTDPQTAELKDRTAVDNLPSDTNTSTVAAKSSEELCSKISHDKCEDNVKTMIEHRAMVEEDHVESEEKIEISNEAVNNKGDNIVEEMSQDKCDDSVKSMAQDLVKVGVDQVKAEVKTEMSVEADDKIEDEKNDIKSDDKCDDNVKSMVQDVVMVEDDQIKAEVNAEISIEADDKIADGKDDIKSEDKCDDNVKSMVQNVDKVEDDQVKAEVKTEISIEADDKIADEKDNEKSEDKCDDNVQSMVQNVDKVEDDQVKAEVKTEISIEADDKIVDEKDDKMSEDKCDDNVKSMVQDVVKVEDDQVKAEVKTEISIEADDKIEDEKDEKDDKMSGDKSDDNVKSIVHHVVTDGVDQIETKIDVSVNDEKKDDKKDQGASDIKEELHVKVEGSQSKSNSESNKQTIVSDPDDAHALEDLLKDMKNILQTQLNETKLTSRGRRFMNAVDGFDKRFEQKDNQYTKHLYQSHGMQVLERVSVPTDSKQLRNQKQASKRVSQPNQATERKRHLIVDGKEVADRGKTCQNKPSIVEKIEQRIKKRRLEKKPWRNEDDASSNSTDLSWDSLASLEDDIPPVPSYNSERLHTTNNSRGQVYGTKVHRHRSPHRGSPLRRSPLRRSPLRRSLERESKSLKRQDVSRVRVKITNNLCQSDRNSSRRGDDGGHRESYRSSGSTSKYSSNSSAKYSSFYSSQDHSRDRYSSYYDASRGDKYSSSRSHSHRSSPEHSSRQASSNTVIKHNPVRPLSSRERSPLDRHCSRSTQSRHSPHRTSSRRDRHRLRSLSRSPKRTSSTKQTSSRNDKHSSDTRSSRPSTTQNSWQRDVDKFLSDGKKNRYDDRSRSSRESRSSKRPLSPKRKTYDKYDKYREEYGTEISRGKVRKIRDVDDCDYKLPINKPPVTDKDVLFEELYMKDDFGKTSPTNKQESDEVSEADYFTPYKSESSDRTAPMKYHNEQPFEKASASHDSRRESDAIDSCRYARLSPPSEWSSLNAFKDQVQPGSLQSYTVPSTVPSTHGRLKSAYDDNLQQPSSHTARSSMPTYGTLGRSVDRIEEDPMPQASNQPKQPVSILKKSTTKSAISRTQRSARPAQSIKSYNTALSSEGARSSTLFPIVPDHVGDSMYDEPPTHPRQQSRAPSHDSYSQPESQPLVSQLPHIVSKLYQHEDLLPVEISALLRSPEALDNPVIIQVLKDLSDAIDKLANSFDNDMKIAVLKEYTVQLLKRFA